MMVFKTLRAAQSELARRRITERYKHKIVRFWSSTADSYRYTICLDTKRGTTFS